MLRKYMSLPADHTNRLISHLKHVADIISTVEFDHTGDYLATGDKGGRVVLFERNESVSLSSPKKRYIVMTSFCDHATWHVYRHMHTRTHTHTHKKRKQ
jgi:hypothetical protein